MDPGEGMFHIGIFQGLLPIELGSVLALTRYGRSFVLQLADGIHPSNAGNTFSGLLGKRIVGKVLVGEIRRTPLGRVSE